MHGAPWLHWNSEQLKLKASHAQSRACRCTGVSWEPLLAPLAALKAEMAGSSRLCKHYQKWSGNGIGKENRRLYCMRADLFYLDALGEYRGPEKILQEKLSMF